MAIKWDQTLLSVFKGPTSKGSEGKEGGEEWKEGFDPPKNFGMVLPICPLPAPLPSPCLVVCIL